MLMAMFVLVGMGVLVLVGMGMFMLVDEDPGTLKQTYESVHVSTLALMNSIIARRREKSLQE
jgi:hypothetical protein